MILTGKKSILFPITRKDYGYLEKLIQTIKDETKPSWLVGNPPPLVKEQSEGWLARTKEGKASRNIGMILFTPLTVFSATMQYLIDNIFYNGIDKELKNDRYTYAEDVIRIALDKVFENGIAKVEVPVMSDNKLTLAFLKRVGFRLEGHFKKDEDNYFLLTIWKEEKKNGIGKKT